MANTNDTIWKLEIRGRLPHEAPIPAHVPDELVMEPNFEAPSNFVDPYEVTERVFDDLPPVYFSPRAFPPMFENCWCVTRYEDIRAVYQNQKLYSTEGVAAFHQLAGESYPAIPLGIDPPMHGHYRSFLNPHFTQKAVDALEPRILATIDELLDVFADTGHADIAYDFSRVYPVRVFLDVMGFPRQMLEEFLSWGYAILHSRGDAEKVGWGIGNAVKWIRGFVGEIRSKPREGLASIIAHGEVQGRPIREDEVMGTLTFLWLGGLDTVAAISSLMFRRLALEPDRQQELRNDPDLHYSAVEEFLRVSPVVQSPRKVIADHEIRGVKIKAGDWIRCMNSAGNFDPDEFPDPRSLRFDREVNRHFTLAGGPHRCLGSHLARRELRLALGRVLERIPPFRMAEDADRTVHAGLVAAPHVPIVWDS